MSVLISVGPDLDPNSLTLTIMFRKKDNLEKSADGNKSMEYITQAAKSYLHQLFHLFFSFQDKNRAHSTYTKVEVSSEFHY